MRDICRWNRHFSPEARLLQGWLLIDIYNPLLIWRQFIWSQTTNWFIIECSPCKINFQTNDVKFRLWLQIGPSRRSSKDAQKKLPNECHRYTFNNWYKRMKLEETHHPCVPDFATAKTIVSVGFKVLETTCVNQGTIMWPWRTFWLRNNYHIAPSTFGSTFSYCRCQSSQYHVLVEFECL